MLWERPFCSGFNHVSGLFKMFTAVQGVNSCLKDSTTRCFFVKNSIFTRVSLPEYGEILIFDNSAGVDAMEKRLDRKSVV